MAWVLGGWCPALLHHFKRPSQASVVIGEPFGAPDLLASRCFSLVLDSPFRRYSLPHAEPKENVSLLSFITSLGLSALLSRGNLGLPTKHYCRISFPLVSRVPIRTTELSVALMGNIERWYPRRGPMLGLSSTGVFCLTFSFNLTVVEESRDTSVRGDLSHSPLMLLSQFNFDLALIRRHKPNHKPLGIYAIVFVTCGPG